MLRAVSRKFHHIAFNMVTGELRFLHLLFTLWILLLTGVAVSDAQCVKTAKSAQSRLRENLLCNYDKLSRPVKNINSTVQVSYMIDLKKLTMEEHSQTIIMETMFRMWWNDEFLTWKPSEYEQISYIRVDEMPIWLPDLTVYVINQGVVEHIRPTNCMVSYTGVISCLPSYTLSAPCSQNVRRWPFEQHDCRLEISSYSYYEDQLNLTAGISRVNLMANRLWDIQNVTSFLKRTNLTKNYQYPVFYPVTSFSMTVIRHAGFFAAATVVPAIMLLAIVLNTFCLGNMVSSRLTCLGFVIFSCSIYLSYLMYLVPSNGEDVPVIVTLFRDCLSLATFGVIISTMVKKLSVAESVPPLWLSSALDRIELGIVGRILMITDATPLQDDETAIIESSSVKKNLWASYGILLDRISFICCFIVVFVLLLGYLP